MNTVFFHNTTVIVVLDLRQLHIVLSGFILHLASDFGRSIVNFASPVQYIA